MKKNFYSFLILFLISSCQTNDVIKTHGTCEYKGCSDLANRTQRLINNEPAHYNEPLISIEGSENFESYECRCLDHHYIPGKP